HKHHATARYGLALEILQIRIGLELQRIRMHRLLQHAASQAFDSIRRLDFFNPNTVFGFNITVHATIEFDLPTGCGEGTGDTDLALVTLLLTQATLLHFAM